MEFLSPLVRVFHCRNTFHKTASYTRCFARKIPLSRDNAPAEIQESPQPRFSPATVFYSVANIGTDFPIHLDQSTFQQTFAIQDCLHRLEALPHMVLPECAKTYTQLFHTV